MPVAVRSAFDEPQCGVRACILEMLSSDERRARTASFHPPFRALLCSCHFSTASDFLESVLLRITDGPECAPPFRPRPSSLPVFLPLGR